MRRFLYIFLALFVACAIAETPEINAAAVTWKDIVGSYSAEPRTTFCLVTPRETFRETAWHSATKNVQSVTDEWLKRHPSAKLIRVYSMRGSEKDPDTMLTFVLVVDGDESLNCELVRQGCLPMPLEFVPMDGLQIPKGDYAAFIKKLLPAAEYAEQHKLGVFGDTRTSDD